MNFENIIRTTTIKKTFDPNTFAGVEKNTK